MRRALALAVVAVTVGGAGPARAQLVSPQADLMLRQPQFALGARVRGLWVTPAMTAPFLATSTLMQNASLGIEFIYRRVQYDVVTSLDFSFISPADGNYLGVGRDPSVDSHYVQFHDLNFLSVDVSIIGHTWLTRWLEVRYGAGVGLGLVLGDVLLTNNFSGCTKDNAGDVAQCHPQGVDLTSPAKEAQLKATEANAPPDIASNPRRHASADKPPVAPVVNLLVALSLRIHPRFSAQLELGFRDAIFFGVGAHYWF